MVATYGESWNLFHSDAAVFENAYQSPSSAIPLETELASQARDSPATPGQDILAEVQRLRQELSDIKRARSMSSMTDAAEGAAAAAAPVPVTPKNAPGTVSDGASDSSLPRCWDPCCNGRAFSNQSNLARHRREKRGEAAKLRCSFCDAAFSRSSARNAHEAEKRCRSNASKVSNNSRSHNPILGE